MQLWLPACITLISANMRTGVAWGRVHRFWTKHQWGTILFTDGSRFRLNTNSRHVFLWRILGINYLASNVRDTDYNDREVFMVWGGNMLDWRMLLPVLGKDSVIDERCREDILVSYARFFNDSVDPNFILTDQNRAHVEQPR